MRFAFTEQQLELRDALATVLARECTVGDLRALAEANRAHGAAHALAARAGRSEERWQVLAELGAVGLLVDEADGGLGLGPVELVGVLEEAGRVALPEPLGETALAAPLLDPAARAEVAAGRCPVAVGGVAPGRRGPVGTTTAVDGRLVTPGVVAAPRAGRMLLVTSVTADGRPGWAAHLVGPGAEVHDDPTLDPCRTRGRVVWDPSPDTALAVGDRAAEVAGTLCRRMAFGAAAQLVGLADRMVADTVAYALERHQFGRPIGGFQAVKHHLADARVRLEFARPALYRAADSLARDLPSAAHDTALAKALASDAAELAAAVALQVHGAIGYTWECDLHFFMKRAWELAASWGDAPTQRARVLALAAERLGRPA